MNTKHKLYRLAAAAAVTVATAASIVVASGSGVAYADDGDTAHVTEASLPRIASGTAAPTPPAPPADMPAPKAEVTPPPVPEVQPNGTATAAAAASLTVSYRCGSSVSSGTILVPALVGSCLFATVPTALPTSNGTLSLHVIVTPTATFYNQVVGIGYRNYNIGMRLDGALGSPVDMTLSIYNVNINDSFSLCSGSASVAYSVPVLGTRVEGIVGGVGWNTLGSGDTAHVDMDLWSPSTSTSMYVDFTGGCGGTKEIYVNLPSNVYSISGWYNSYTFYLTGPPTYIDVKINDSGNQQWFSLSHNSSNLSGNVNLGAYGTLSFTNAPRYYYAQLIKDGGGEMSSFYATASNAPGTGTNVLYNATISGIAVHVDVRGIKDVTFSADMANKVFYGDIHFYNQAGYSNSYVQGSWHSVAYKVSFTGSGMGHLFLYITTSPYFDFEANLHSCSGGCGVVNADVNVSFWGISAGTGFGIWRNGSGTYHLRVPFPLIDTDVSEGWCGVWLGFIYLCGISS